MCFAGGCNRLFEGGPWHSWERSCLIQGDGLGRGFGKRNKMISIFSSISFIFYQKDAFVNMVLIANAGNQTCSAINVFRGRRTDFSLSRIGGVFNMQNVLMQCIETRRLSRRNYS